MTFEDMATTLESSGDYRILRRLQYIPPVADFDRSKALVGISLDVETTGLVPLEDEIISLAMVPFYFCGRTGRVLEVLPAFNRLREPSKPISDFITRLTGIDSAMVAGREIGLHEVIQFASQADIVIAHNASFDRKFCEAGFPGAFEHLPWTCSMGDCDYGAEGIEGTKLCYLASGLGFFYGRHKALEDALAVIRIVGTPLPVSGTTPLSALLDAAVATTVRVWAVGADYTDKHVLKGRGYRWNSGEDGRPKAWCRDVVEGELEGELLWLSTEAPCDPEIAEVTALNRSARGSKSVSQVDGLIESPPALRWPKFLVELRWHREAAKAFSHLAVA